MPAQIASQSARNARCIVQLPLHAASPLATPPQALAITFVASAMKLPRYRAVAFRQDTSMGNSAKQSSCNWQANGRGVSDLGFRVLATLIPG